MKTLITTAIAAIIVSLGAVSSSFAADVKTGGYTIEHTHHQESERIISFAQENAR